MVKQFLTLKGKEFEEVNVDEQPDRLQEAVSLSGTQQVPVTTDGTNVIVGWQPAKLMGIL